MTNSACQVYDDNMRDENRISYGRAARLRVVLAELAADISDYSSGIVSTYADGDARGGEYAEMANRVAGNARELLTLAVAYERQRGTSWEVIGETLGTTRQSAHERYAAAVKQLDEALTESWLLGDDPRFPGLPAGASDPADTAGLLDRWVISHLAETDALAHKPADDPDRVHPVSGHLKPLDTLEHSSLAMSGAELISERFKRDGLDDPKARLLEHGLARRKVELYERMIADQAGGINRGTDTDTLRDLLAGARARLADLEQSALETEAGQ